MQDRDQAHQGSRLRGLYLVTPDWDDSTRLLEVSEQALRGGATLLQYRHKSASAALREEQAGRLLALCRAYRRPLIINDHAALCLALDADGLHLGAGDLTLAQARALLGGQKIIGASCYGDPERAQAAARAGASYVAFGGFYPSRVKRYALNTRPEILQGSARAAGLPMVVIGGMTPENTAPLVARGADMVAAISSVYLAADAEQAARTFVRLFDV